MTSSPSRRLGVSLIGCGEIGGILAKAVQAGRAGSAELRFLFDRDQERSRRLARELGGIRVAESVREILSDSGTRVVVEAASQAAVVEYGEEVLRSGKDLMVMSVGALADEELLQRLLEAARRGGSRIHVPSGSIPGVDGVKAAHLVGIKEAQLTTRKPPVALSYSPYLKKKGVDLSGLREPLVVFEGTAREAVRAFPESVNIAATLGLAGIGLDRLRVRIIADPSLDRNVHELKVVGEAGEIMTVARNVPSPGNPRTSYLAALSAIMRLRDLVETLLVGT
ncbi:MAG: aspartate dehydrogenase [Candidatus Hadarchaeales archaeon]